MRNDRGMGVVSTKGKDLDVGRRAVHGLLFVCLLCKPLYILKYGFKFLSSRNVRLYQRYVSKVVLTFYSCCGKPTHELYIFIPRTVCSDAQVYLIVGQRGRLILQRVNRLGLYESFIISC